MFDVLSTPFAKVLSVLIALAVLQLASCGSPEDRAKSYYEHGMKLLADHDNARAAIELRNAVKLQKDLVGAWRGLAQIDEANKNWGGVIANLRTVADLDPSDIETKLKLGKLLLLANALDESLKVVNSIIETNGRSADAHALKAAVLFKLNERAGAVQEAQSALQIDPALPDALMILAGDRLAQNDPKGALAILEGKPAAHEREFEKNLGFQLLRIRVFEQLGDLSKVAPILQKLVEIYPDRAEFRKLLIKFYIDQKRPDEAEKEMRALATANPNDAQAGLDVVRFVYSVKKNPAGARQELVAYINGGGEIFTYRLALADMDFSEGNLPDGVQVLQNIINSAESADHIQTARLMLAQMYFSRKQLDDAEKVVSEILSKDGRNTNGLKLRASVRMERGQLDGAITDLREALNDQPHSTELMLLLAIGYERSGSIELAERQFSDATRASEFDVNVGLQYVAFLRRRGNADRVEDVLAELNSHRPNNIQILSALAQARLARQNWTGAQEIAEQIRRIGNAAPLADEIKGAALAGSNKYDESIAAFQSAYDAAPTAAQPMASLVRALVADKKTDRAVAFLKSVLASNASNVEALVLLGSVQLTINAPDEALKNFSAAVKAQPKNIMGYQALSQFYIGKNNTGEAEKTVRSGIQEIPASMELHLTLAGLLERKGDYEGAISEYDLMLDKQSGNLIAVNNLASLLSDHRTDKASLDRAQTLAVSLRKSQVPQFKDTLGWISYRQGDYKTAVPLFEEAVAALPNLAPVRYHLGMTYIATGQPDKASEQLKKTLELSPTVELAGEARAALQKIGRQ